MEIRMIVRDEVLKLDTPGSSTESVIDKYMRHVISGKLDKGVQYLSEQFDDSFVIMDEYKCDVDENEIPKYQYKLAIIREGGEIGFLLSALVLAKQGAPRAWGQTTLNKRGRVRF